MKIATWNIERPTHNSKKNAAITAYLHELDADILILTETNEAIQPDCNYQCYYTSAPTESFYKAGERRTSIYTKYELAGEFDTFRSDTSICKTLRTPFGDLHVYGTVIGINGNRRHNFTTDLDEQVKDFERIAATGNFCLAGDLNMSFCDNYYFTDTGRKTMVDCFNKLNLVNLTGAVAENIDHIVLSKTFITGKKIEVQTWNEERKKGKLSDHMGVCVTIT